MLLWSEAQQHRNEYALNLLSLVAEKHHFLVVGRLVVYCVLVAQSARAVSCGEPYDCLREAVKNDGGMNFFVCLVDHEMISEQICQP